MCLLSVEVKDAIVERIPRAKSQVQERLDEEKAAIVARDVRPCRETSALQDEIGKKQLQRTVESRAASVEEPLAIPLPTFSATQFTFDIRQLFPFHQFADL